MTLRTLTREIRDYPATAILSLLWLLVFAGMLSIRLRDDLPPGPWQVFVLGMGEGHRFGDLTLQDLARGEAWRLITCTFVHYSVIHIALNLLAFYLLGTLIESWYGPGQLVFIYAVTGGLGNLISVLIRHATGSSPLVHSGGGSVVIMGLIGLCAVVGWRSGTATGSDLGWQMFKALGLTGLLGIAFPRYIDNWGHAGGALVGFPLGLLHRWFLRQYSRPAAWATGLAAALVILGCGLAQWNSDRREAGLRRDGTLRRVLNAREATYRNLRAAPFLLENESNHDRLVACLDAVSPILDHGQTRDGFRRLRGLAVTSRTRALSPEETAEFKQLTEELKGLVRSQLEDGLHEFWNERRKVNPKRR